jgi:hypothetical protein
LQSVASASEGLISDTGDNQELEISKLILQTYRDAGRLKRVSVVGAGSSSVG